MKLNQKYRRILTNIFMTFFIIIGITLCVSGEIKASVKDDIKTEISQRLSSGKTIKKVYYCDYDKNGRKEAFVITGYPTEFPDQDGVNDLWFAYKKSGKVYATVIKNYVLNQCKVLKLKSVTLFCAAEYCATSTPMDVYKVTGNEAEYIFQGDSIRTVKGNSFTSIHSTYDALMDYNNGDVMMSGHTWKPYWFYYKKGRIYQYKAKKISKNKFKKNYMNAAKILKQYKSLGNLDTILYRSNGYVHINYTNSSSKSNVTLKVKGKRLVKPVCDAGIYLKKMPIFEY